MCAAFAVIACAGVGASSTAGAAVPETIEVTASPSALRYPADRELAFEVKMTTGAEEATFALTWRGPVWPGGRSMEGSPLAYGPAYLSGPGTIEEALFFAVPVYAVRNPCGRGSHYPADRGLARPLKLQLPPSSSSSLLVPARLVDAPWPGVDYRPAFFVYDIDAEGQAVIPAAFIRRPPVEVRGRTGVRIRVRVPRKERAARRRGLTPTLIGTTFPRVRRQPIHLRAVRFRSRRQFVLKPLELSDWRSKRARRLGSARTDRQGRFRLGPRRLRRGRYRILARYTKPRRGLVADWGCGPPIRVR